MITLTQDQEVFINKLSSNDYHDSSSYVDMVLSKFCGLYSMFQDHEDDVGIVDLDYQTFHTDLSGCVNDVRNKSFDIILVNNDFDVENASCNYDESVNEKKYGIIEGGTIIIPVVKEVSHGFFTDAVGCFISYAFRWDELQFTCNGFDFINAMWNSQDLSKDHSIESEYRDGRRWSINKNSDDFGIGFVRSLGINTATSWV